MVLKKLLKVAGLLLSMSAFAGEDPEGESKKNNQKQTINRKSLTPRDFYSSEIKLYPRNRIDEIKEILKKIPVDAITQFLTASKVMMEADIKKLPYVIDFPGEHVIAGAGTRIYVRSIPTPKSIDYSIYRQGEPYLSPETKELLGHEALYIANARLQQEGEPATLMITKSNQEVRVGDRLMEFYRDESAVNYFPKIPEIDITGSIIRVLEGVLQIGKYNIVVIDKGEMEGLKRGHVLDIYQRGRKIVDRVDEDNDDAMVQLPDELAGTLMIFRSFKQVSYALVMKATQAIHVLDKVKTPTEGLY
jgi:hypothetical protein